MLADRMRMVSGDKKLIIYDSGVEKMPINGWSDKGNFVKEVDYIQLYGMGDYSSSQESPITGKARIYTDIFDMSKYKKMYVDWELWSPANYYSETYRRGSFGLSNNTGALPQNYNIHGSYLLGYTKDNTGDWTITRRTDMLDISTATGLYRVVIEALGSGRDIMVYVKVYKIWLE